MHVVDAAKLSIYEFAFEAQKFGVREIQTFMNDHEIAGFREAVNHQIQCNNVGILRDPAPNDYISIGKCYNCNQNQFEIESCYDLPSMNGHYFFFSFQQFFDANQLYEGFKFSKYLLKVSNVFITCSKEMKGSRLIPFPSFWKVFQNAFPSLNLNKSWFAPKNDARGFMIEIPDYISTELPSKFKSKLHEEKSSYNNDIGKANLEDRNEMKLQWFPNTERNYQLYAQIEKTHRELLRIFSFEQVMKTGKLNQNDIKDLPLFKIPVITSYMDYNHMEEDVSDDDDDSKNVVMNLESQSPMKSINHKKESTLTSDEEEDEYDSVMNDDRVNIEELTEKSEQPQFKIF